MTKLLKFKHLFHYNLQMILCNVIANLSLMKDHKGLLFVYLFVCFIKIETEILYFIMAL